MKNEKLKNLRTVRFRVFRISLAVVVLLVSLIGGLTWNAMAVSPMLRIDIDQREPFFSPAVVTAIAGTVIEWQNRTGEPHTIRADDCLSRRRCSFDSGMIMPNRKFTVDNLQPGEYTYHCGIHPFMRGKLMVRRLVPNVGSESI